MSAAEVLALHQPTTLGDSCRCGTGWQDTTIAAHQLDALKAAGYAVVEVPPGGWIARMVPIDPQAEEGNFLGNDSQWYRAADAAEADR